MKTLDTFHEGKHINGVTTSLNLDDTRSNCYALGLDI